MLKKILIGILVLIILVIGGYFGYQQYAKSESAQKAKSERLVKSTIEAVGRLINLPEGDNPQVAIVSDLTPLSGQPFFRNAEVGDRVIIYENLGRAILYNPRLNKIMEIATLQPQANPPAAVSTKPATATSTKVTEPKN